MVDLAATVALSRIVSENAVTLPARSFNSICTVFSPSPVVSCQVFDVAAACQELHTAPSLLKRMETTPQIRGEEPVQVTPESTALASTVKATWIESVDSASLLITIDPVGGERSMVTVIAGPG